MQDTTKLIYHYTSFEKLQCILKHGTLRFKESTKSNDILDTVGLVNILKAMPRFRAPIDMTAFLNFLLGYYQRDSYAPSTISLVACFSKIPDSRLLWDAYTMHRPGNTKCLYGSDKYCYDIPPKYNGVCIAFKQNKLQEMLDNEISKNCDNAFLQDIDYGNGRLSFLINEWLKEAAFKAELLNKDPDQAQNLVPIIPITSQKGLSLKKSLVIPMAEFITRIDENSPFFKHEFWREEQEVRASLSTKKGRISKYSAIQRFEDGTYYSDINLDTTCIDHFILGPEFDNDSLNEIEKQKEFKIKMLDFELKKSLGTGVIRNN